MDILHEFKRALARCHLPAAAAVAVAVSGGVDSMVLLALCRLLRDEGIFTSVCAIHINHRLRPAAETTADHRLVRAYCAAAAITLRYHALPRDSRSRSGGLEAAARAARLDYYATVLRESSWRYLLTAHHRDDNVETVLLRLLQGGGLNGLAAMPLVRPMTTAGYRYYILRPLLQIEKRTLYRWARDHAIPYREDSSNTNVAILRNAVRHDILPAIKRHFPAYCHAIERMGDHAALMRDYIARAQRRALVWQFSSSQARITLSHFFSAHRALQFQSFYDVVDRLGITERVSHRFVRQCLEYRSDYCGRRGEGYGVCCSSDARYLYISRAVATIENHYTVCIEAPRAACQRLRICISANATLLGTQLFKRTRGPIIVKLTERNHCTILAICDSINTMIVQIVTNDFATYGAEMTVITRQTATRVLPPRGSDRSGAAPAIDSGQPFHETVSYATASAQQLSIQLREA